MDRHALPGRSGSRSALPLSRRWLVAAPTIIFAAHPALAQPVPTPRQTRGPFYPATRPADSDLDLTQVTGRPGRARGEVIEVTGRVLDARSGPLAGATVEIWQADAEGRYHHPRESSGTADPNFQGFGAVRAGSDGGYFFRTIRPRYYGSGAGMRTPHIHFRIVAEGRLEFVTQMYFPGEAMNAQDGLFRSLPNENARDALTARLETGAVPRFRFEIVVA